MNSFSRGFTDNKNMFSIYATFVFLHFFSLSPLEFLQISSDLHFFSVSKMIMNHLLLVNNLCCLVQQSHEVEEVV